MTCFSVGEACYVMTNGCPVNLKRHYFYRPVIEASGRLVISGIFSKKAVSLNADTTAISPQQNAIALTQNTFSLSENLPYPNPSCRSLYIKHTALLLAHTGRTAFCPLTLSPNLFSIPHTHISSLFTRLSSSVLLTLSLSLSVCSSPCPTLLSA